MKNNKLFKIATPIFFEILLFMLLGVADTFMLSHYGTAKQASMSVDAVGMSNQVIGNINILFAFISAGTAVLIAQYFGAKNTDAIKRVASVSLGLNLIFGLLLSSALMIFGKTILIKLGLTDVRLELANSYLKIVGGFMVFQALLNTVAAIIRSHGDTQITLKVTIGMNIMNVIGDAIFIYGLFGMPVLGVKGVAIATTFSRIVALMVLFIILFKRYLHVSDLKYMIQQPLKEVKALLKIGVPSAMENLSFNLAQTVMASLIIVHLSEVAFTTRVYAVQISWFILIFGAAVGQATQIMVGQHVGAKEFEEAYHTCMVNFRKAFAITLSLSVVLFFLGSKLIGLYTVDPDILKLGAVVLMVDAILEPGRTFNLVIISGLRGSGDVVFPVVIGIMFMWGFGVLTGYMLATHFNLGLVGFWIGMALDEWLRGFVMYGRWHSRKWETKRIA
ncbi:MAG: MATE family efflux transporter [Clostridia bacterium]|nr:MATE family efflux transporter [Clostridia bacterium]